MSKKRIIAETQIRRWGKLAAITPLTENFLNEEGEEELEMDDAPADDLAMDAEAPALDMEMDAEAPAADASPEIEAKVEDIVATVVAALTAETGVPISMEGGEEAPALDAEPALDDAPALDAEPAMDAELAMGDEEEELAPANRAVTETEDKAETETETVTETEDKAEDTLDEVVVVEDDEVVEAVLTRVVERLLRKAK